MRVIDEQEKWPKQFRCEGGELRPPLKRGIKPSDEMSDNIWDQSKPGCDALLEVDQEDVCRKPQMSSEMQDALWVQCPRCQAITLVNEHLLPQTQRNPEVFREVPLPEAALEKRNFVD